MLEIIYTFYTESDRIGWLNTYHVHLVSNFIPFEVVIAMCFS